MNTDKLLVVIDTEAPGKHIKYHEYFDKDMKVNTFDDLLPILEEVFEELEICLEPEDLEELTHNLLENGYAWWDEQLCFEFVDIYMYHQ